MLDMIQKTDARFLSCLDDYHVRLIARTTIPDEEIMKFETSFREVLIFIKDSKDNYDHYNSGSKYSKKKVY